MCYSVFIREGDTDMTNEENAAYAAELRAAGYSEAQIAKEVKYVERVAVENERIRSDRAWNYGIIGPEVGL
jgi:hypothetical protein